MPPWKEHKSSTPATPPNNLNLFPPLPYEHLIRKPLTPVKVVSQANQAEEKRGLELLEAVQKNTTEETEQLLQQGANPNMLLPRVILSSYGIRKPIFFSATLPNLRVLLAHGADPNLRSSNGNTLLNQYCAHHERNPLYPERDMIDEIRLLLHNNADVNLSNDVHETPLHSVCRYSVDDIVIRLLLERGAEPNLLNMNGQTPLHCIAENRVLGTTRRDIPFTQSIKLLIDAGADPSIRNEENYTASERAAFEGIPTHVVTALQHAERGLPLPPHPPRLELPAPPVPVPYAIQYRNNGNAQDPFHYPEEAQNNRFGGGRRRHRKGGQKTRRGRRLTRKRKARTHHHRRRY